MTLAIGRRQLLKVGMFGIAAIATPGAAQLLFARGFTHGVASGEPAARSVLLWTRYVGGGETPLQCEVAGELSFSRIVGGGAVIASESNDYCAKLVVDGLEPDRWYYYRFIAPDGSYSDIGRTRTLPLGDVKRFGVGVFSCANMPFGWFNAYAHAAARNDLDLLVHVGDYLYEYGSDSNPQLQIPGRPIEPRHEMVTLQDHRLRYAAYRADPDLRRLHQLFPMIAQWDDHEFANDAWMNGAGNHQPDQEGDWQVRTAIAKRVYREWLPVSDDLYNVYEIGSLATLFRLETRLVGRMEPLDIGGALAGHGDLDKAIADFRDNRWNAPDRTILGARQEAWLASELQKSTARGKRWQIVAQQVVMGALSFPADTGSWVSQDASPQVRQRMQATAAISRAGLPFNMGAWDGYPAARDRLLKAAQDSGSNLIVLSGDSHNAWGNNLRHGGKPAGVEYASSSVTSPGLESFLPLNLQNMPLAMREANPDLIFADIGHRGYVSLQITPSHVRGAWHFAHSVKVRSAIDFTDHPLTVRWGERRFADA